MLMDLGISIYFKNTDKQYETMSCVKFVLLFGLLSPRHFIFPMRTNAEYNTSKGYLEKIEPITST